MSIIIALGGPLKQTLQLKILVSSFLENGADLILAADSGYCHLQKLNLEPAIVFGDFDSLTADYLTEIIAKDIDIRRSPCCKDETDFELLTKELWQNHLPMVAASKILILGALSSDRPDHQNANIILARQLAAVAKVVCLTDGQNQLLFFGKSSRPDTSKDTELKPLSRLRLTFADAPIDEQNINLCGCEAGIENVSTQTMTTQDWAISVLKPDLISLFVNENTVEIKQSRGLAYELHKQTLGAGEVRGISNCPMPQANNVEITLGEGQLDIYLIYTAGRETTPLPTGRENLKIYQQEEYEQDE